MEKTRQKEFAVSLMRQMCFDKKIIDEFISADSVYLFETNVATRIDSAKEIILAQIEKLESLGSVVYAVIHNKVFGMDYDIYNFLIVPEYEEDWGYLVSSDFSQGLHSVEAYCLNLTKEQNSEYGHIGVLKTEHGFERVG